MIIRALLPAERERDVFLSLETLDERSLVIDSDQGAVRERLATLGASGVKN